MNYLSHFCIAERECNRVVAVGSLLPDYLDNAGADSPTHRIPKTPCASAKWPAVVRGIAHHLEVDRLFHGGDWFENRMRDMSQWLKHTGNPLRDHWSLSLLRHVTIELVLDGELLNADADLPERLYVELAALAADGPIMDALQTEFCRPNALRPFTARFLERRWLHLYAETDGLADVLDGIFSRMVTRRPRLRTLNPDGTGFSPAEREALPEFITAVRENVRANGLPNICTSAVLTPMKDDGER